jgi:Fe2+ transport system protein FeoA
MVASTIRPTPPARRTLDTLRVGECSAVDAVDLTCPVGRRLVALGFAPGAAVQLLRVAPLADPMEFDVRGARVSLRRADAARIALRA